MRTIGPMLIGLFGCVLLTATYAHAAEGLDAQTRQLWERHWRVYAQNCAEFEGEFLCCPAYNRRYPSSAGMTVRQAEAALSERVYVGGGGVVTPKTIKMPIGEAEAMAMPIPRLAVGEYGYLVSGEIEEILGPASVVLGDLYLIDARKLKKDYSADRARARRADDPDLAEAELEHAYSQRTALAERQKDRDHRRVIVRLEGYPTRGMNPGERWDGPGGEGIQLLIVRQEYYGDERRPKRRLVAVAPQEVQWGLDEAGFIRLLEARGLDPQGFVKLIMDIMAEEDPDTARGLVFKALLPTLEEPGDDKQQDRETADDDATEGNDVSGPEGPDNK